MFFQCSSQSAWAMRLQSTFFLTLFLSVLFFYASEVKGQEQDDADEVTLPISKGQLASLLGTIPETLSRIFAKMGAQGLIEVKGRKIRLLDRMGLKEVSELGKALE